MPIQVTTQLPDAQQPMLDTSVEDQLGVQIDDITNYGDYRVQIRETGETAWDSSAVGYHEAVLSSDSDTSGTLSTTFQNLEDGEEYESRIRTETEHVNGAWTTPVSGTLPFPVPTNLQVDDRFDVVNLSYQDNSDNESNVKLQRSPTGEGDWTTINTYDPNTTTVVDDTRDYFREFDYRIRQSTEHEFGLSNVVTVLPTPTKRDPPVSPVGWTVAIEHPETERMLHPDVLGDPVILPSLNSLPEVRIPVRPSSTWLDPALEDNPRMDVWLDGEKQPIDELREVDDRTDRTILVGVGGVELEQRIQREYSIEGRRNAANAIIAQETSYNNDVDIPVSDTLEGRLMQSADSQIEIEQRLNVPETTPLVIENGTVTPAQTCWTTADFVANNSTTVTGDNYTGGEAQSLSADDDTDVLVGGRFSLTIDPDYVIPADGSGTPQFEVAIRGEISGGPPQLAFYWDEFPDQSATPTNIVDITVTDTDVWQFRVPLPNYDSDIEPGEYELYFYRYDTNDSADLIIDAVAPHDTRFNYNFDTDLHEPQGHLDGPAYHPLATTVETEDAISAFNIDSATATLDVDDASNGQRVQLSSNRGQTWEPTNGDEENTDSVSTPLVDGATLRMRTDLAPYAPSGPRDETPRLGYDAQTLDGWTLEADLSLQLLLIDQTYDDSIQSILTDIAGEDFLWSYHLDDDGNPTISWTQPGQRTAARDPDLGDANIQKRLTTWGRVVVKGSNREVEAQTFTADTSGFDLGTEADIEVGSERVYDDADVTYDKGVDYEISYNDGTVTAVDGGSLSMGSAYSIDYNVKTIGAFPEDGTDVTREFVESVPAVTSEPSAEQIAYVLYDEFSEPRYSGDLVIPRADVGFDALEALSLTNLDLPDTATPLEVRGEPQITPTGIQVRLGSRGRLEDALSSIAENVRQLNKRT